MVAGTAKKLSFKSIFFKWEISILMGKKDSFIEIVQIFYFTSNNFLFWQMAGEEVFRFSAKFGNS